MKPNLLTDKEHELLADLGRIATRFAELYEEDKHDGFFHPNSDIKEVVNYVHILQTRVMSRAASRGYPARYRRL